ncbi:hypothetical protein T03_14671 [Trichinella britovi]|uniref:Uncharacterized protein n=2 Tax=Trichinella TaxID=6333 RepID=A0A0V1CKA8_TRIBR|nr:hypothetical protein T09_12729 [Trichinella sp. T9]KRY49602.1 hypothetical protein T03_14671 [Trichinella britovi]
MQILSALFDSAKSYFHLQAKMKHQIVSIQLQIVPERSDSCRQGWILTALVRWRRAMSNTNERGRKNPTDDALWDIIKTCLVDKFRTAASNNKRTAVIETGRQRPLVGFCARMSTGNVDWLVSWTQQCLLQTPRRSLSFL